jgi:phage terminase small subunit
MALDRDGHYPEGKAHPALRTKDRAETRMRHFMGELGLSPAMRSRIQIVHQPNETPQGTAKFLRAL